MKVEKIDGKIERYNFSKIDRVVRKAFKSCTDSDVADLKKDGKPTEKFIEKAKDEEDKFMGQLREEFDKIVDKRDSDEEEGIITIDEIQAVIIKFLGKKQKVCVIERYIAAKKEKERKRELKSRLVKGAKEKLEAQNVQNQNANVDEHSFGGRIGEASRVVTKQMALDYYMTEMARNNHLNNEIYIHDLDSYAVGMHNCLSIPFDDLLAKGFSTRQTDVRPASSVNTAFQLVAVIFQLQSLQQFGGVSATHLDWTMVPYVRKSFTKHLGDGMGWVEGLSEYKVSRYHKWLEHDNNHPDGTIHLDDKEFKSLHPKAWEFAMTMLEREIYQAVEGMYHNLNTLQSRSGNQLPFTSINYGTCALEEGRMITKALLEVSLEGLGKNRKTAIFPCGIFQYMKGVNDRPGTPNYDLYRLALKSTSHRLYPNYANVDWSGNAGYDDVKVRKEAILNKLTPKQREVLSERLKEHPEYGDLLGITIE